MFYMDVQSIYNYKRSTTTDSVSRISLLDYVKLFIKSLET